MALSEPQRNMKMCPSWSRVCLAAVGDRSRATPALAEPAYEYGWGAEKNNEFCVKVHPSTTAPTIEELREDADFIKAKPTDQQRYLQDVDPDFAQASSEDKAAYLHYATNSRFISEAKPKFDPKEAYGDDDSLGPRPCHDHRLLGWLQAGWFHSRQAVTICSHDGGRQGPCLEDTRLLRDREDLLDLLMQRPDLQRQLLGSLFRGSQFPS